MRRAAATLVVVLAPVLLLAQGAPTDFARGADIHTGDGSLFRVLLPDDVYETVTRADFGDIRVFNGSGDAVPHTLRVPPPPIVGEADWVAVPSFPMADLRPGGSARTQVKIDTTGAVLEVTGSTTRQATSAYLIDVSALKVPLSRLALSWNAPASITFLTRVRIEESNDLNTWRTLVPSAAIAQLQRDTFVLVQNEVEVPDTGTDRTTYLRMSWPKELSSVTLTSVRVRPRATVPQAPIRWRTLTAQRVESSGAAVYDTEALLPVEYVDLDFMDGANAVSVTVLSHPTPDSAWQRRHGGLFYSLQEANGAIHGPPAHIAPTTDRYWSIRRTGGTGWPVTRAPRLKLGWHPHELVFVAQGAPPYTLVYGSARVGAVDTPVNALLATLDEADRGNQVRAATLGPPRNLGGADALRPAPPLRRTVLWTVLTISVALLAWLAIRTFRDVARPAEGPPPPV